MGARTGAQFLEGLRERPRWVSVNGRMVTDVTTDPQTSGAAATLAGVFDRQHELADEILIADDETGEPINISHMHPRSIDDLWRRVRGLTRIAEHTVGLMGRTPDYMNMKFAGFSAVPAGWIGANGENEHGAHNLVEFQKRLRRQDISLTHTIIQPNIDKRTDGAVVGNQVTLHKVAETPDSIIVRGARILATLAPFADELAVYPALPIPPGAEDYALAFSIPMDIPGLRFLCRDSASTVDTNPFDRPLSSRFDEQDAFVIFDDVEIPCELLFLDGGPGSVDIYNQTGRHGVLDNMTTQSTIRALTKLEFAYGLASRMAETIGDYSPSTMEMLGELLSYVEVTRNAIHASTAEGREYMGAWFPGTRAIQPMRSLLAVWMPRVNEIITMIGSHNLLATPSLALLQDPDSRPLIDEFLHGADGTGAVERAALFRLAWEFVGSHLGGRNVLYERFYLTSAARNRTISHMTNFDRSRPYALVDHILTAGKEAAGGW